MLFFVPAALAADDAEIREHLLEVAATLRSETPRTLPALVRERRLGLLDALESYAWAGDYPSAGSGRASARRTHPPRVFESFLEGPRVPRFVDDEGTHCAVGYLMALDSPDLVSAIQEEHELDWLGAMTTPGLGEWAGAHGFTQEELAWIQPSYSPTFVPRCGDLPDIDTLEFVAASCGLNDPTGLATTPSRRAEVCGDRCDEFMVWAPVLWNGPVEETIDVQLEAPDGSILGQSSVTLQPNEAAWVGPFTIDREDHGSSRVWLRTPTCESGLDVGSPQGNVKVEACAVTCSQVGLGAPLGWIGGSLVAFGLVARRLW